jgi:hypothetical protein
MYWPAAHVEHATQTPLFRKYPALQALQAPTPVQAVQWASQFAQVASLVRPQPAV